jgi:hypothetical protein
MKASNVKSHMIAILLVVSPLFGFSQTVILDVIRAGVKKVIKAVDLKIQRIQTKTIWLQNAQKEMENAMQFEKLTNITDWINRQRQLYQDYFDELWKVKKTIADLRSVGHIVNMEKQIIKTVGNIIEVSKRDKNISAEEIVSITHFLNGVIQSSSKLSDIFKFAATPSLIQTSDGKRLIIIHDTEKALEDLVTDISLFSDNIIALSLQRSNEARELSRIKFLVHSN